MGRIFAFGVVAIGLCIIGFLVGRHTETKANEEDVRSLVLVEASRRVAECTSVLTAMREGNVDGARDRLEIYLDTALVEVLRHYSPTRDEKHSVARSIRAARAYRAKYPRAPERGDVQAALALPVPSDD